MEETISLRELVEIILKGKWLIAIITAVAVLIAALASFVLIDPVYSAKATVSINNGLVPGKQQGETDSYFNEIITPAAYIERVKSPQVIEAAIKKSGLEKYNVKQVESNLTIESVQNTNLVHITLKGTNPSDVKKMLDSILLAVKESLFTEIQKRIKEDSDHFAAQAKIEKEKLERLLKEYRQKAQVLQLPPSLLLDAVISYNNQYIINLDQARLQGVSSITEKDLISLNELSNEIKSSSDIYREYLAKEQQLQAFAKNFSVDNKVLTISAPVKPETPDSPKPLLNIAIAFVVSLMTSIGVVFFRHYWQESK
ncbi:capsular polysaccharide biosynthesis protein [Thermolongibacillus altinsuensis]|uniref:Capsular polysaccharide biosynthesis protein n=1 Tax=Thermolongibacillus altinsuensis TaxID=575256 RepID=A0A4R1QQ05_9BACL|nr:Wzz/FepE/Etk N-terminal domain-containing protein [Thermolongibacillus altinsuensis]TCL52824.1 capsular polysaccharide biosynthesis protein [Thermolongibacillus altinsuensis]